MKIKHNMSYSRLYRIWKNMKQRVYNPKNTEFHNYGGRGIVICDEWHSFIPFMEWALANGYNDELTIERVNNDIGYNPYNCKWIPSDEQKKNIRGWGNSKYKGVYFEKERNKFQTGLKVNGKKVHLGRFDTEFEAALAYDLYCIENNVDRPLNVLGVR
jgi:hypothetical protein